jgi:SAM-dependent methyltransferase
MEERKLNIGSGPWLMQGYVNIDDMSDWPNEEDYIDEMTEFLFNGAEFIRMDGNKMKFEDESFDEVRSEQCIPEYVNNWDEVLRVLRPGGKIELIVWNNTLTKVIDELIKRKIEIRTVEMGNGDIDDGPDEWTIRIVGWKQIEPKTDEEVEG